MPEFTTDLLSQRISGSKINLMDNQPDPNDKNKIITFQITPKRSWKVRKLDSDGYGYDYFTTMYHLLTDTFDFGTHTVDSEEKPYELHDHHFFDLVYYIEPETNFMNQVNGNEKKYINKFSGPISIIGRNYQENNLICKQDVESNNFFKNVSIHYSELLEWINVNKDYPRLSTIFLKAGCIYYVKYLGLKETSP
jgi:hypothetical protein